MLSPVYEVDLFAQQFVVVVEFVWVLVLMLADFVFAPVLFAAVAVAVVAVEQQQPMIPTMLVIANFDSDFDVGFAVVAVVAH